MSGRRLLVLDAYDADAVHRATHDGRPCDVLLLGLSREWFRWFAPALP
jgi:hypothetical protein